jgi:hypothetical protein
VLTRRADRVAEKPAALRGQVELAKVADRIAHGEAEAPRSDRVGGDCQAGKRRRCVREEGRGRQAQTIDHPPCAAAAPAPAPMGILVGILQWQREGVDRAIEGS